jgi:hypothetical protein
MAQEIEVRLKDKPISLKNMKNNMPINKTIRVFLREPQSDLIIQG